jgi:hypothetical protein
VEEGSAASEVVQEAAPSPQRHDSQDLPVRENDTKAVSSKVLQVVQDEQPAGNSVRLPSAARGPSRLSRNSQFQMFGDEPISSAKHRPSAWTDVTTDDVLVEHLLALYFCWEYPTFASFSKEHFLLDYNSGHRRFCSSLLVNAILAIGARFSDLVEARMDRDDHSTAGDQFFNEAQRLLGGEANPTILTVQALNLMSLRQAGCGNDASGWHYARHAMRIALDLDLPNDDPNQKSHNSTDYSRAECQVRVATFWGCFALEQ